MSLPTDLLGDGVIHGPALGGVVAPVLVSGVSAATIAGVSLGVTQGQRQQGDQSKELREKMQNHYDVSVLILDVMIRTFMMTTFLFCASLKEQGLK